MFRRLTLILTILIVSGCSSRSIQPLAEAPGGNHVQHWVIQNGQSPTNWVFFPIGNSLGAIVASGPKTLWYPNLSDICKIDMLGQSTCYFVFSGVSVDDLSIGPDKNIWFIAGATTVGRMSPTGGVRLFQLPDGVAQATVAGPDGNVWIAIDDRGGVHNGVIKLSPFGVVLAEYDLIDQTISPRRITVGPDGNIWVTGFQDTGPGAVFSITTSGSITEYPDPVSGGQPFDITKGADGNLWFTEFEAPDGNQTINEVGNITTSGVFTFYDVPLPPGPSYEPGHLVAGPGRLIWFVDNVANAAGSWVFSVSHSGAFVAYPTPDGNPLNGIAAAGDGNLWTNEVGNAERIAVLVRQILTVTPSSLSMSVGDMAQLTVSETKYQGSWTASSSNKSVATVATGPPGTFTVTAVKAGFCTIMVADKKGNSFPVGVIVQ